MVEIQGNMWEIDTDCLFITTNGFVKRDGSAVMGRGCALEATKIIPDIAKSLGQAIERHGNRINLIGFHMESGTRIYSFPTKPVSVKFDGSNVVRHMAGKFTIGQTVAGWAAKSSVEVIQASVDQLTAMVKAEPHLNYLVPRAGCGVGELNWEDIQPMFEHLPDNVRIITF